jgi:hypothetical protein
VANFTVTQKTGGKIKECFMKNTIKVLGIVALIAIIGFSMAACSSDDDNNSNPKWPDGFYADDEHYWQHSDEDLYIRFEQFRQEDQFKAELGIIGMSDGHVVKLDTITSTSFSVIYDYFQDFLYNIFRSTITYSLSGDTLIITDVSGDDTKIKELLKIGTYTRKEWDY